MNRMSSFLVILALPLAVFLALLGLATTRTNLLGWFLMLVGGAYSLGVVWVYWIRKERFWESRGGKIIAREETGDRSFWWIALGMIAAFYLPPLEYLWQPASLPRTGWMQIIALILLLLGIVIFIWARRTLRETYSGHVSVVKNQVLEQRGPYRFIRHPAYAGYILMAFAIALGYSSLVGLIAFILLLLPAMIFRIRVEDRLLAEHFGPQFASYARRTKRLIPGIW